MDKTCLRITGHSGYIDLDHEESRRLISVVMKKLQQLHRDSGLNATEQSLVNKLQQFRTNEGL